MKDIIKRITKRLLYNKPGKASTRYSNKISVEGNFNVSVLRMQQNELLRETISSLPGIKSVLNIGALPDENDKEGSKYQLYFKDTEFYTLDRYRDSPDKHHLHMDLHDLSKLDKKFDLILFMSTLEHVENPFVVAKEIESVMAKESYLYISVPFFYPIHKDVEERYSDYWRFTDDALRLLFKDLNEVWIKPMKTSIKTVQDRGMYWEPAKVPAGFAALFKKI